jgi:hypothetical protein
MSLASLKFTEVGGSIETDLNVAGHLIADLDDEPSETPLTAAQLKAAFDYLVTKVIGPRINDILDLLVAVTDSASGADNIGATAISGVTGATVQAILEDLKDQIDGVTLGSIGDGSLTDAKLSTDAAAILARFAAHALDFASHAYYLGTTGGTSTAYTVTDGDFTFDTDNVNILLVRFNADCGDNPTININGGGAKTLKPNLAATLEAGQIKANGMYMLVWYPTTPATMYILNPDLVNLTLAIADITGLQTALDGKAAAAHVHAIANVTGLQTALDGKSATGHSHVMASITDLAAALALKQAVVTGAATTVVSSDLTANKVIISNASGKIAVSTVTDTELGYLSGVTSALQTQLNGKMAVSGGAKLFVASSEPTATGVGDIWIETA